MRNRLIARTALVIAGGVLAGALFAGTACTPKPAALVVGIEEARSSIATAPPPVVDPPPLPPEAFAEGPCGPFSSVPLGKKPASILGGRLSITPIEGLEPEEREHDVMEASPALQLETRLDARRDGRKLVLFAEELMVRPGPNLVAAIRKEEKQAPDALVGSLPVNGLRVVAIVPKQLTPDEDKALALGLYVITPDDLIVRVRFFMSADVAPQGGGCSALARRMVGTLTGGSRRVDLQGGPRDLEDGLTLDVPPNVVLVHQRGPDFTVYHAALVLGFGQESDAGFGVYLGNHPEPPHEGARTPGQLLGQPIEWVDRQTGTTHRRETIVQVPWTHGVAHVFFAASDPAVFGVYDKAARSLRKTLP